MCRHTLSGRTGKSRYIFLIRESTVARLWNEFVNGKRRSVDMRTRMISSKQQWASIYLTVVCLQYYYLRRPETDRWAATFPVLLLIFGIGRRSICVLPHVQARHTSWWWMIRVPGMSADDETNEKHICSPSRILVAFWSKNTTFQESGTWKRDKTRRESKEDRNGVTPMQ
jgi:hypothetical protein